MFSCLGPFGFVVLRRFFSRRSAPGIGGSHVVSRRPGQSSRDKSFSSPSPDTGLRKLTAVSLAVASVLQPVALGMTRAPSYGLARFGEDAVPRLPRYGRTRVDGGGDPGRELRAGGCARQRVAQAGDRPVRREGVRGGRRDAFVDQGRRPLVLGQVDVRQADGEGEHRRR